VTVRGAGYKLERSLRDAQEALKPGSASAFYGDNGCGIRQGVGRVTVIRR